MDYNTTRPRLRLPEYGRTVQDMVQHLTTIADRKERTEQAYAVIKTMELLNPQVKQQDDWQRKLWDHLIIISDFELDVDSPFPAPEKRNMDTRPEPVPLKTTPIHFRHYGRNIESIIDLVARQEEGEVKTQLILQLASYMRRQYLIWNKDSVSDETLFKDIERISEGTVKVPEGLALDKLSPQANFARPGQGQPKNDRTKRQGRKRNFKK